MLSIGMKILISQRMHRFGTNGLDKSRAIKYQKNENSSYSNMCSYLFGLKILNKQLYMVNVDFMWLM